MTNEIFSVITPSQSYEEEGDEIQRIKDRIRKFEPGGPAVNGGEGPSHDNAVLGKDSEEKLIR